MLFPTVDFLLFFVTVFALHWALARAPRADKTMLLLASWFFYACWDWRFVPLLAWSATLSFVAGRLIEGARRPGTRRFWVIASVALQLVPLAVFKYHNFLAAEVSEMARAFGASWSWPMRDLLLPVGISFFTFQGISYILDVARRAVPAARVPLDVLLYISFFPHLVAGPIVRAAPFLPQLAAPVDRARVPAAMATLLILGGLFKKAIIANSLGIQLVDPVFRAPDQFAPIDLWLAVYGYAVQIYCDFSAYSDIAIGVAALLGFHFPRNFNQPYRAQSLTEFWRRWHISLSLFLRDYLYVALGGNRRGRARMLANLFIVMVIGGIWHGAAWSFVLWGALHGGVLVIERILGIDGRRAWRGWWRVAASVITFHVVCAGWILFRAGQVGPAWELMHGLFTGVGEGPITATPWLVALIVIGMGLHFLPPDWMRGAERILGRLPAWGLGLFAGVVLVVLHALGPEGVAPFIYFQF